jgi:hypothetical protein
VDLLTPERLAAELDIDERTLANWRHRGGGPPFVKVGRFPRYRRIDVDRWLEANRYVRTREPVS